MWMCSTQDSIHTTNPKTKHTFKVCTLQRCCLREKSFHKHIVQQQNQQPLKVQYQEAVMPL